MEIHNNGECDAQMNSNNETINNCANFIANNTKIVTKESSNE